MLPRGRSSSNRSESHLSLSISAVLGQADQTTRVEPSLTTAHDRYVTTWKWSRMHSNHTEPELTLGAHHHLEAWRERQSRGWSPRDDMLSWPGHHFEMIWDAAVWASHNGSGRQGAMWHAHRNWFASRFNFSCTFDVTAATKQELIFEHHHINMYSDLIKASWSKFWI